MEDNLSNDSNLDYPADLTTTFFTAAERRDYRALRQCLRAGIDPNVYKNHFTVLHIAAANGDATLLEYMIKLKKTDINIRTMDFNMTPLHLAAKNQYCKIVDLLLKHGADIEAITKDEKRPIHLAILSCNMKLIKTIQEYKPMLDVMDTFSHTPLSIAVLDRHSYVVAEYLCRNGASPSLPRPNSLPLLYEAILNVNDEHYLKFIKLLVKYGSDVNEIDVNGRNAFHYAAITGSINVAQFLRDHNCDGTLLDKTGRGPIHFAVMHGNAQVAMLISTTFDIEIPMRTSIPIRVRK